MVCTPFEIRQEFRQNPLKYIAIKHNQVKEEKERRESLLRKAISVLVLTTCLNVVQIEAASAGLLGIEDSNLPVSAESEVPVMAETAVLIDATTGRLLWGKQAHQPMPPASTTKVMAAILILEKLQKEGGWEDKIVVSKRAATTGEASVYLEEGEIVKVEDLFKAMMLNSANDAAVALAEWVTGDLESFVREMNLRAQELGATRSRFYNPHGLSAPGHVSTAYDLSILTRHAFSLPTFGKIVSLKRDTMPWPGRNFERLLVNQNRLLTRYPGADGVKTGYTREAGNCVVGSATRDGFRLVAVVMKSPSPFDDLTSILDHGFSKFRSMPVVESGNVLGSVPVAQGMADSVSAVVQESLVLPVRKDEENKIVRDLRLEPRLTAPVSRGSKIGEMVVRIGEKPLGTVDLVADNDVPPRSFWLSWIEFFRHVFNLGKQS